MNRRAVKSKIILNTPSLREVQERLQAAILGQADGFLDLILDNSRTTRVTLFGVYRNAYVGRLVEILQNEYAILATYCGDARFRALAESYIAACPSNSQNARWFGTRLPAFLRTSQSCEQHPELANIADIENAVSNAFDAADVPVLDIGGVTRFPADAWGRLIFTPHASVSRVDVATNAFAIWKALKDDAPPPASLNLAEPEHIIVWRQDATPMVRVMGREEAMMWTEASRGVRFEVLCEMLATFDDPETAASRAAGYLQGWLGAHMLTAVALDPPPRRKAVRDVERPAQKPGRRGVARA